MYWDKENNELSLTEKPETQRLCLTQCGKCYKLHSEYYGNDRVAKLERGGNSNKTRTPELNFER